MSWSITSFTLAFQYLQAVKTINWIRSTNSGAQIHFEPCNLASFKSIRKCVASLKGKISKVDFVINNAGSKIHQIMCAKKI